MIEKQPDKQSDQTPSEQHPGADENFNLTYRASPDKPLSILPADDSLGVGMCIVETIKDDTTNPASSRTIAVRNIAGDRYQLEIRYAEAGSDAPSLNATLQINGRESLLAAQILYPRVQFPVSLKESDLAISPGGLKHVVHEAIFEFRVSGAEGVLNYLQSLHTLETDRTTGEIVPLLQESENPASFSKETCIGNLRDLSERLFNSLPITSHQPEVTELPGLGGNFKVAFHYPDGPSLVLNILPVNPGGSREQHLLVQQATVLLPSDGILSKYLFTRMQESHFIDVSWQLQSLDFQSTENQIKTTLQGFRDLVADFLGGTTGKVSSYFSSIERFHAAHPLSSFAQIRDWARPGK
jgi:hypothetical protein